MKHKVSELEGALLDAAVAKAEAATPRRVLAKVSFNEESPVFRSMFSRYSTDWAIIERERITCWKVDEQFGHTPVRGGQ